MQRLYMQVSDAVAGIVTEKFWEEQQNFQLGHLDLPAVAQICAVKLLSQAGNKWQAQARPCATRTCACTILPLGALAHPPNHLSACTPRLNDKLVHICSTLAYWRCIPIHAQGSGAVPDGCMCPGTLMMLAFRMTLPDRHRDSHSMAALPRCKTYVCQSRREACGDMCWMTWCLAAADCCKITKHLRNAPAAQRLGFG